MKALKFLNVCVGLLIIQSIFSSCVQCKKMILAEIGISIEEYNVHNI